MDNRKVLLLGVLPALSALTFSSCGHHKSSDQDSDSVMSVDVALPVVDSIVVRSSYPGYLEADKAIDVVARVDGYVTGKTFKDGDKVTQGEVLFTIEDSQYRDAVTQAEAQLATAKATTDYATRQYNAMKQAFESDAVSQMDVVKAENSMREAVASVKSAEAALRTANTNLSYCTVRAAVSGHIAAPAVSVGDYVSGSGSPVVLTTIYDDSWVSAKFSIEDSKYLELVDNSGSGDLDFNNIPVTFNDTLPHSYSGKLDYLAPSIDKSTGTMILKVRIENPYSELKSGMYANVGLPLMAEKKAILVEESALSTDQLGKYLYVVNDSNKIVYTPVKIGDLYADTLRVITDGLSPTDRYVTKALLKVKNGMTVKPVLIKK